MKITIDRDTLIVALGTAYSAMSEYEKTLHGGGFRSTLANNIEAALELLGKFPDGAVEVRAVSPDA